MSDKLKVLHDASKQVDTIYEEAVAKATSVLKLALQEIEKK